MKWRSKDNAKGGKGRSLSPFSFLLLLILLILPNITSAVSIKSRVHRVIDGDTIVLKDGRVVRYLGVNAPERVEAFYQEAKRANEELVLGREIKVVFDPRHPYDGGGRLLGYVFVDALLVNAELLRRGYAHLFCLEPIQYYQLFYHCQEEARQGRRGIWALKEYAGPFKVTTVKGDAPGDDRYNLNGEYVRICNVSPVRHSLRGFRLCNRRGTCYTFARGELDPGYTALLFSGPGRDYLSGPQLTFYWGSKVPLWDNDGDVAVLYDPHGEVICRFPFRKGR